MKKEGGREEAGFFFPPALELPEASSKSWDPTVCLPFLPRLLMAQASLPHCSVFVYGSEVENRNVCHCYWFVSCVTTWFAGSRTKAVSPLLKPKLCALGAGRGEGNV